jgi:uncharacterized protein YqjF (DUF2071 family)
MYQRWSDLTFLHWAFDPAAIRPIVPPALALDTFDSSAWIGLTPFLLEGLRAPFLPAVPWLSRSPETNVRTYVLGPDGTPGIWFLSLDIARLPAFVFARTVYRLPYMWSSLEFDRDDRRVRYRGKRRLPTPDASYSISVEAAEPFDDRELGPLDHFLTARWRMFTTHGPFVAMTPVEHQRWPLHRARVTHLDETLLGAAGVPRPTAEPLVHFSPGVDTRIGPPRVFREPR